MRILNILSILFYLLVALTILAVILAVGVSPKYYWLGALTSYIFSFLGGFTIGLCLLSITFILLALALAHTWGWIHKPLHSMVTISMAVIIWLVSIKTIDDYWLFWPLSLFC